jgi:predicted RNA-binding protein
MCLSTVYIDSGGDQEEVMRDVAYMQAKDEGFLLIGLLGEQNLILGKVKVRSVDFVDKHTVVLEKDPKGP